MGQKATKRVWVPEARGESARKAGCDHLGQMLLRGQVKLGPNTTIGFSNPEVTGWTKSNFRGMLRKKASPEGVQESPEEQPRQQVQTASISFEFCCKPRVAEPAVRP